MLGVVSSNCDPGADCGSRCGARSTEWVGSFKGISIYRKPGNAGFDVAIQPGNTRNLAGVAIASTSFSSHCSADRAHVANYLHFGRCYLGNDRLVDKYSNSAKVAANA